MRRLLSALLLGFFLVLGLAVPGFAADSEEAPAETTEMTEEHSDDGDHAEDAGEHADEDDHGDDHADDDHAEDKDEEGQWTGLIAAFGAAVVFGTVAFFWSGTEGLGGDHGDHH